MSRTRIRTVSQNEVTFRAYYHSFTSSLSFTVLDRTEKDPETDNVKQVPGSWLWWLLFKDSTCLAHLHSQANPLLCGTSIRTGGEGAGPVLESHVIVSELQDYDLPKLTSVGVLGSRNCRFVCSFRRRTPCLLTLFKEPRKKTLGILRRLLDTKFLSFITNSLYFYVRNLIFFLVPSPQEPDLGKYLVWHYPRHRFRSTRVINEEGRRNRYRKKQPKHSPSWYTLEVFWKGFVSCTRVRRETKRSRKKVRRRTFRRGRNNRLLRLRTNHTSSFSYLVARGGCIWKSTHSLFNTEQNRRQSNPNSSELNLD